MHAVLTNEIGNSNGQADGWASGWRKYLSLKLVFKGRHSFGHAARGEETRGIGGRVQG